MNCKSIFLFAVTTRLIGGHTLVCPPINRVVTAKIRLSLRRNTAWTTTTVHYDWALLTNRDVRDKYTLILRNKFDALQDILETPSPNDKYENFVNAHLDLASGCKPSKQRTKHRLNWESLAVRKKRANLKTTSKCNWRSPNNINALELKKAQRELTYY